MTRIQSLAFALAAMFAVGSSACTAESTGDEDALDGDGPEESVGTAESAASSSTGYSISSSGSMQPFTYGDTVPESQVHSCTMFTNGVIRSWHLKEKNAKDFRYSRHWCRDMESDGTLGTDNDFYDHFYHDGSGTLGTSYIPLDRLPVGVRIQAEYQPFGTPVYKISDVAMLYASAADVYAHHTGYTQASYALGRSDSTYTISCPAGQVMTGLGVHENTGAGGPDQSEISGLKIHCQVLVYE